jgi:hypothetical protein
MYRINTDERYTSIDNHDIADTLEMERNNAKIDEGHSSPRKASDQTGQYLGTTTSSVRNTHKVDPLSIRLLPVYTTSGTTEAQQLPSSGSQEHCEPLSIRPSAFSTPPRPLLVP